MQILHIRQMQCFLGHGRGVIFTFPGFFLFFLKPLVSFDIAKVDDAVQDTHTQSEILISDITNSERQQINVTRQIYNLLSSRSKTKQKWSCYLD